MEAQTLKCPMCGAPQASDATLCDHCGARLATIACPSCFGLVFQGSNFCSHCGAKIERPDPTPAAGRNCPRCKSPLEAAKVGVVSLLECGKCEGIWLDTATFEQICADREEQVAILGMPGQMPVPESGAIEEVHYVPCPVCHKLMNRINFANCSHVIVDVCVQHGTWFDRDELRKIIEFIRAGGMEKARQREISELQQERSLTGASRVTSVGAGDLRGINIPLGSSPGRYDGYNLAFDAAGVALRILGKFLR